MPAWIHSRADHIRRKNPGMPKAMSFAIATQQAEATGHTPKGYGTAEGRKDSKAKYDKPKSEYEHTADPSSKSKSSSVDLALLKGFSDEMQKIAAPVRKSASARHDHMKLLNPSPQTLPPPLATEAGTHS